MKELIEKIDFFAGLDDRILKKLSDACIVRTFDPHETIVRQGEMGLGVYIISQGRVKIECEQNGVMTQLAELGPEQFFGEMSIVDNKPRSATVTSLDQTQCVLLTRDSMVRMMNKYPEIPIRMTRVLAERLRVANVKLSSAPQAVPSASQLPPPIPVLTSPSAPMPVPAGQLASGPPLPAVNGGASDGDKSVPAPHGTKASIQKTLLDTFSSLYTMKALTRFSVAVLGCPVEASAANLYAEVRAGDVKVLFLPADEAVEMSISAYDSGMFTLHVFEPSRPDPTAFGPLPICLGDRVLFSMRGGRMSLAR